MRREAPTRVITVPQSDESPEHGLWMPMDMDDPDMLELFDALDVERLETNVENALVTNASPDVIPPLPLRDQGQPPPCPAVPMDPPSRRPAATPTTSATATEEPRPLRTANRMRQECQHHRRTAAGSNSFIHQIKCKDCGVVLFRTPSGSGCYSDDFLYYLHMPAPLDYLAGIESREDCGHKERFAVDPLGGAVSSGREAQMRQGAQQVKTRYYDTTTTASTSTWSACRESYRPSRTYNGDETDPRAGARNRGALTAPPRSSGSLQATAATWSSPMGTSTRTTATT